MKDDVYKLISQCKLAVVSTINRSGKPESALVGIAVTPELEIIFDTVTSSRKYDNIIHHPNISMVVGWDNETTVQYEGIAEVLDNDASADNYREIYFETWPDGRGRFETWPGLVYIKVTPKWVRYSNFNVPAIIEELIF
ncbi:MAG TPA: pyridoxamine 5'-phosphate oxidase family protein [Mucilaginibacter sp.]|nr:pyridoxamine 5'-phosphate oxidase family protein [Mucilaginibacter sp.]